MKSTMNHASWIFLGVFATFAAAWLGLVFYPNQQLKDLQVQPVEGTRDVNPAPYSGQALTGRQVYVANGCLYCHSQQVRGGKFNADLNRGWGARRSDPLDYIHDYPQLMGTMRTGPDLINIGARQPSAQWHLLHLYDPQITSPGSIMPPFRFLFETRPIPADGASPDALALTGPFAPAAGMQVIPRPEAKALVAYLKSLDRNYDILPPLSPLSPQTSSTVSKP